MLVIVSCLPDSWLFFNKWFPPRHNLYSCQGWHDNFPWNNWKLDFPIPLWVNSIFSCIHLPNVWQKIYLYAWVFALQKCRYFVGYLHLCKTEIQEPFYRSFKAHKFWQQLLDYLACLRQATLCLGIFFYVCCDIFFIYFVCSSVIIVHYIFMCIVNGRLMHS